MHFIVKHFPFNEHAWGIKVQSESFSSSGVILIDFLIDFFSLQRDRSPCQMFKSAFQLCSMWHFECVPQSIVSVLEKNWFDGFLTQARRRNLHLVVEEEWGETLKRHRGVCYLIFSYRSGFIQIFYCRSQSRDYKIRESLLISWEGTLNATFWLKGNSQKSLGGALLISIH
jgi:hypothetical protein